MPLPGVAPPTLESLGVRATPAQTTTTRAERPVGPNLDNPRSLVHLPVHVPRPYPDQMTSGRKVGRQLPLPHVVGYRAPLTALPLGDPGVERIYLRRPPHLHPIA